MACPGTIRRGASGPTVVNLQKRLGAAGWSVAVDGIFGSRTESSVKGFQAARGLQADGVVGPATWDALGAC